MPDSSAESRPLPFNISHYRVERQLGAGAMGAVYVASDRRDDQPVALKLVHPRVAGLPGYRDRFDQEAHSAALLRSPYTVKLLDYGVEDRTYFLVMEYVAGPPLSELLGRGALPVGRALRIAWGVARALEEAEARGLVHRDIKPENILVIDDETVKTADFGIARGESGALTTAPRTYLGSPALLRPRTVAGRSRHAQRPLRPRATLYHMLVGRPPYQASTVEALIESHRSRALPREGLDARSDNVANIVRRCLEKDPRDRYQHASELAAGRHGRRPATGDRSDAGPAARRLVAAGRLPGQ